MFGVTTFHFLLQPHILLPRQPHTDNRISDDEIIARLVNSVFIVLFWIIANYGITEFQIRPPFHNTLCPEKKVTKVFLFNIFYKTQLRWNKFWRFFL